MKKSRFSDSQIIAVLKQAEADSPVKVGSDSIATDHSSNNSECVPVRTKMMALPSRR